MRVVALLVLLQVGKAATSADPKQLIDGVGIAIRLEMIPVFIMFGWGAAATTVVGQNLGSGNPKRRGRGDVVDRRVRGRDERGDRRDPLEVPLRAVPSS